MFDKDALTKEYLSDPEVFADIFNQSLYHGRQVISAEQLHPLDSTQIVAPHGKSKAPQPKQNHRDLLKVWMSDGRTAYCVLGLESQSQVHYAMPVRNGLYDFMQLSNQVTETAAKHERQKKVEQARQEQLAEEVLTKSTEDGIELENELNESAESPKLTYHPNSGEYLSHFWKTDRLLPVVTLVVYFSPNHWDGPLTLREMYAPAEEVILQSAPDYRVHLVSPETLTPEEFNEFHSSLREVLLYIRHSKNSDELQQLVEAEPKFKNLGRQAVDVLNAMTNSQLEYDEDAEVVDVCLAIQTMREESMAEGEARGEARGRKLGAAEGEARGRMLGAAEGEARGKIQGCIQAYLDFHEDATGLLEYVMKSCKLAAQEAEEYIRKYR